LTAEVHPKSQVAVDIMRLQFYLIGINSADLVKIKKIENGRIEYIRSKTGVQYSIKVEPEAQAILDKYTNDKGEISITIPSAKIRKPNKEELHKGVTSYWMRHSWASIASEIDIPIETISKALGHNIGVSVTHIYINFNSKKIDEANRKVIDYVLYGKK
jgi:integrase